MYMVLAHSKLLHLSPHLLKDYKMGHYFYDIVADGKWNMEVLML